MAQVRSGLKSDSTQEEHRSLGDSMGSPKQKLHFSPGSAHPLKPVSLNSPLMIPIPLRGTKSYQVLSSVL